MQAMGKDLGVSVDTHLYVDASAAIGIAQRNGLGKLGHLDTQALWIQDAVRSRRAAVEKVKGTESPADLMTEHLDGGELLGYLQRLGVQVREGRAEAAPELVGAHEAEAGKQGSISEMKHARNARCRGALGARPRQCTGSARRALSAPAARDTPRVRFVATPGELRLQKTAAAGAVASAVMSWVDIAGDG